MVYATYGSSYGFTSQQQQKIVEALNQKLRSCPSCGKPGTLQLITDGVVNMPISPPNPPVNPYGVAYLAGASGGMMNAAAYANRTLPCIALTCNNCGHIQFHSVIQLGLAPVLMGNTSVSTGEE